MCFCTRFSTCCVDGRILQSIYSSQYVSFLPRTECQDLLQRLKRRLLPLYLRGGLTVVIWKNQISTVSVPPCKPLHSLPDIDSDDALGRYLADPFLRRFVINFAITQSILRAHVNFNSSQFAPKVSVRRTMNRLSRQCCAHQPKRGYAPPSPDQPSHWQRRGRGNDYQSTSCRCGDAWPRFAVSGALAIGPCPPHLFLNFV